MSLWVITCHMEGCEECSNEHHVVGVFSTANLAKKAEERHKKHKHLHSHYINSEVVEINEYRPAWEEK